MTTSTSSLGTCPRCGDAIPRRAKLIEYEKTDGTTGRYAECAGCGRVIAPD